MRQGKPLISSCRLQHTGPSHRPLLAPTPFALSCLCRAALKFFGTDDKTFRAPQLERLAHCTPDELAQWKQTNERLREQVEVGYARCTHTSTLDPRLPTHRPPVSADKLWAEGVFSGPARASARFNPQCQHSQGLGVRLAFSSCRELAAAEI